MSAGKQFRKQFNLPINILSEIAWVLYDGFIIILRKNGKHMIRLFRLVDVASAISHIVRDLLWRGCVSNYIKNIDKKV